MLLYNIHMEVINYADGREGQKAVYP